MKIRAGLLAAVLVASCQPQSSYATPSPSKSIPPSPSPTTPIAAGQLLGAPGCKPPSPATPWKGPGGPPEGRGTPAGGGVGGLVGGGPISKAQRMALQNNRPVVRAGGMPTTGRRGGG